MDNRDLLIEICVDALKKKGLCNAAYQKRLMLEIKDVDNQGEHEYFLDLYRRKIRFPKNENNLLIAYLLDLVDDFDINQMPVVTYGDWPDVDLDYVPEVRDYLKNIWAPKTFGKDNVCCIGNYTTFGIKSALIDMARVFGKDRKEVLMLTTVLGLKDDEGKALSWEKALELFPDLKAYCEANPEVAEAAYRLLNRNRGMGMHAGGLIISKSRIDNLVPLVKGKDGVPMSAFVEGLHGTDLSPLGLIKFDLLVVSDLMRIYECTKLIKERHGLESICALPGQQDWSDTAYLNDPESLAAANQGKLKCVFQFDSDGIRELAKKGGVTSFDDLVAYTALFRPGPINCLAKGTSIAVRNGEKKIEELSTWQDEILYVNNSGKIVSTKKFLLIKSGKKKLYKIRTKSGKAIRVSSEHKLLTQDGFVELKSLKIGEKIANVDSI